MSHQHTGGECTALPLVPPAGDRELVSLVGSAAVCFGNFAETFFRDEGVGLVERDM